MNPEKEAQLQYIKDEFTRLVDMKFRRGAKEHSESLMDLDLVEEAALELIDGIVYLLLALAKAKKPPRPLIRHANL